MFGHYYTPSTQSALIVLFKRAYRDFYQTTPTGLAAAMAEQQIDFSGRQHSGIDDAKNTAHLLLAMVAKGYCITITSSSKPCPRTTPIPRPLCRPQNESASYSRKGTSPLCGCGKRCKLACVTTPGVNIGRHYFVCSNASSRLKTGCSFFAWTCD